MRRALTKCIVLVSIGFLTGQITNAQSGGDNIYDFLNLTSSARAASLGGQQISLYDNDLNLVFYNPALLTEEMDKTLTINYVDYFAGINWGYVSYAWKPQDVKHNLAMGIHYVNYGKFIEADDKGYQHGTFNAADYSINLYYSRTLIDSTLHFGATLKPIYSDLEDYMSFGLGMDWGLSYTAKDNLFGAGLVIKNIGYQLIKYYPDAEREPFPFEIQLGITKKLEHAPFRFSILAHNLEDPTLRYKTDKQLKDEIDPITGEPKPEDKLSNIGNDVMRHLTFGFEFVPSKNFYVNVGYNFKRRQELKINDRPGAVGFSWGFGMKVKRFHVNYARATYHLAGGSNHISISTNLKEFNKKL